MLNQSQQARLENSMDVFIKILKDIESQSNSKLSFVISAIYFDENNNAVEAGSSKIIDESCAFKHMQRSEVINNFNAKAAIGMLKSKTKTED